MTTMTLNAKTPDTSRPRSRHDRGGQPRVLKFSPTAWAKLLWLRDLGQSEVGGFGIAAADDLLCIENVQLVRQVCTPVSVVFDDQSVADFFDQQVDQGRKPQEFARVWLHTHPGNCPEPSMTDHATFARVFGRTDWAVIFILARGGHTHACLRFHVGPGGDVELPVEVDYSRPFPASDHAAWEAEYLANVQSPEPAKQMLGGIELWDDDWFSSWGHVFPGEEAGFAEAAEVHYAG